MGDTMKASARVAALVLVAAVAGCGQLRPGETCKIDGDCAPTDRCVNRVCVLRSASSGGAGTAVGATGGSASSSTGRSATSTTGTAASSGSSGSSGHTSSSSGSGSSGSNGSASSGSSGSTGSGGECHIGGVTYPDQAIDPQDPCAHCETVISTSSFTRVADGTVCAGGVCLADACLPICFIGGSRFDAGALNPFNECQDCAPPTAPLAWSNVPDGQHCQTAAVCLTGNCSAGCFIDGGYEVPDAGNANQPCEVCTPESTVDNWSTRPDGFDCAAGQICAGGTCQADCYINGSVVSPSAVDPSDPCEACAPTGAGGTHAWSALPDALNSACPTSKVCHGGSCVTGCFLDGQYRAPGSTNPANPCEVCNPATSTSAWSAGNEGSGCASAQVCHSGACSSGCFINNAFVNPQALNPANSCESCVPTRSTTSYSASGDGTTCTTNGGNYCKADVCIRGCNINNVGVVTAGTLNSSNACQVCDPSRSATTFSVVANGTGCGSGSICFSGACQVGCDVGGAFVPSGQSPSGNPCVSCQPFTLTSNYSNLEGQACSNGGTYCHSTNGQPDTAVCINACLIGGTVYPNGTVNVNQTCQICDTSRSTTAWSARAEGTGCGSGAVCHNNVCTVGCFSGGLYYSSGQVGNGGCATCNPSYSTTNLQPTAAAGTSCNQGGQGLCTSGGGCNLCGSCGTTTHCCDSCGGVPLKCGG